MAENNTLLEKLDGLVSRFEEVSTLITDPNVIADQKRYVKLTKEYKELNEIIKARKEYMQCLNGLEEARLMMAETDPEMREIAREEATASYRPTRRTTKTPLSKYVAERAVTKPHSLPETCIACT